MIPSRWEWHVLPLQDRCSDAILAIMMMTWIPVSEQSESLSGRLRLSASASAPGPTSGPGPNVSGVEVAVITVDTQHFPTTTKVSRCTSRVDDITGPWVPGYLGTTRFCDCEEFRVSESH